MKTLARLKDLGTFSTGLTYSPESLCEENEGTLVLRSSNIKNDTLAFDDCVYVNTKISPSMFVKEGDVLICSRNGSARLVGKTAIIEKPIKATWGAFMMLFRTKYNSRYLYYLLNVGISKSKALFSTSTINQLTNSMLGNIFVDFYSDENEQKKIADYLDNKTQDIEEQINILLKKQNAFTRLKSSIINRAVTKGLNSDVKLKESGIDWIGEIPEHWKCIRNKDSIQLLKGKTPTNFTFEVSGLPYLNMDYLRDREDKPILYPTNPEGLVEITEQEILVLWDGANAGEFIHSKKGYLGSTMAMLKIDETRYNKRYFYALLKSIEGTSKYFANGTTIPHFDSNVLFGYSYPVPPLEEQQAIANYLDEKCAKIDAAIANIEKQIDALKRLKRALINEVVTGKREV